MKNLSDKLTVELLNEYWDEQSFNKVIEEVVRRTVLECAARLSEQDAARLINEIN